jgi:hypothetical protein
VHGAIPIRMVLHRCTDQALAYLNRDGCFQVTIDEQTWMKYNEKMDTLEWDNRTNLHALMRWETKKL